MNVFKNRKIKNDDFYFIREKCPKQGGNFTMYTNQKPEENEEMEKFIIIKYPRIRMSQCSKFCSNRPNCKAFYHKKGYWDHGPCIQYSKGF